MAETKVPEILIFLSRTSIHFFEPRAGFSKEVNIPNGVLKDLEIVDPNALSALVSTFIDNEKIGAGRVVLVLSEAISFTKDIPLSEETKKGILVQDFTDTVPLETPEVKVFRTTDLYKVVGINPVYYQVLMEALTAKGFTVLGVIPASVIPEVGASETINMDTADKVLTGFDKLKFQSFISGQNEKGEAQVQPLVTTGKPKGNTIYILVGVFVIGILVLVALLVLRR